MLKCSAQLASAYTNLADRPEAKSTEELKHLAVQYTRRGFEYYQILEECYNESDIPEEIADLYWQLSIVASALKISLSNEDPRPLENSKPLDSGYKRYLDLLQLAFTKAKAYGYDCIDVPPDGSCFYHAVYEQLKNNPVFQDVNISPDALRQRSVDHILHYLEIYGTNFADDELDVFLAKARLSTYWAHHCMIAALARELNVNIVVLATHTEQPTIIKRPGALTTIYLCNIGNVHFNSLRKNPNYTPEYFFDELLEREPMDDFELDVSEKRKEIVPSASEHSSDELLDVAGKRKERESLLQDGIFGKRSKDSDDNYQDNDPTPDSASPG